jgi:hypothetical protein
MHTSSQGLLPEFDHEMANTRRALERVPEDKFGWKPHLWAGWPHLTAAKMEPQEMDTDAHGSVER